MIEIKHRYTGAVLFSADVGNMRLCVEAALTARADIRYADLTSADLTSADLGYADLGAANLRSANLTYANLRSANLTYANLTSADLRSADLASADLRSANLTSADLRSADLTSADRTSAIGARGFLSIGPVGSRDDTLLAVIDDSGGVRISTGCFSGSLADFEAAVSATHGDSDHGQHYRLAIALIKAKLGGGV